MTYARNNLVSLNDTLLLLLLLQLIDMDAGNAGVALAFTACLPTSMAAASCRLLCAARLAIGL